MDLTIVIPSYNTKELLRKCLSSVWTSLATSKYHFEVIVVDNASSDGTIQMIRKEFKKVILIQNKENVGYGKANNQGTHRAKGKYILLLNSDIEVLDNAIDNLFQFGSKQIKSFCGGKLFEVNHKPQYSCGPFYTLPVFFIMFFLFGDRLGITRYSPNKVAKVDWVSGACLLGKKEDFLAVGLFDEQVFMYMEEIDFLYRAKQKGYTTFFYPNAGFVHVGAASSGNRKEPVLNIYKGMFYFYRKYRTIIEQQILVNLLKFKAVVAIGIGRLIGNNYLFQTYSAAYNLVRSAR